MKLKEYVEEAMKDIIMGTAVDFDINLDKDCEVSNNFTGNKMSFQVIKDIDVIADKIKRQN